MGETKQLKLRNKYEKAEIVTSSKNAKVNDSQDIALFLVSGPIKKLFSIDCVNIYLFLIFFQQILPGRKVWGYPTLLIS